MRYMNRLWLIVALALCGGRGFAQEITVSAARPGGVYAIGEKIVWHLGVKGDGAAGIDKIGYVLKKGSLTVMGRGDLTLKDGAADLETQLDEPGNVYAELTALPPANAPGKASIKNYAGAVVAPDQIKPSSPAPADFDQFWKAKVDELAAVPPNPVLEPGDSGSATVDYWKITMDNIRGTKIRGQVARPRAGTRFPALLIVQWAGVYPLAKDWVTGRAREGWLALNINAHDLPIDAPADFYKQQTALQDYPGIGNDDREKSYFLRMYLSCYRAVDYLAGRDDWDGKTLIVMGTSQGGLQTLMIGGLHPRITALLANVPAGCDHTGPLVGRLGGWPQWYFHSQGKDAAKVIETSRYYDVVNFAAHIKCPALVAVGLIDTTCPPSGVIAAFNQIQAPKELVVMERSNHHGDNNAQAAFYARSGAWLKQLAAGNAPSIQK